MKHEPRAAIQVEKQLVWVPKLRGTESQGISEAGQMVLARLMGSQIWHPPASSVAMWGGGLSKGRQPRPTFLSERKLSPRSHLDARPFSSSPYATGAFQAATLVLKLRGSESELIHVWVLCRKLLGTLEVFCTNLISAIFCSQKF